MNSIIIFFIGIFASYLGSFVSGGIGTLIVGPMLLMGIPPQITKATTRIGSVGAMIGGLIVLRKGGFLKGNYIFIPFLMSIIGCFLGVTLMTQTPGDFLIRITGIFMVIYVILTLIGKNRKVNGNSKKIGKFRVWMVYIGQGILSFFSGFAPSSTGSLYYILYTEGLRISPLEYKALSRITGIGLFIGSIYPIYINNLLDFSLIIPLFIGTYIGGYIGGKKIITTGNETLEKVILGSIFFMGVFLIFK